MTIHRVPCVRVDAVLRRFGIADARWRRLGRGNVNDLWRVHTAAGDYVLALGGGARRLLVPLRVVPCVGAVVHDMNFTANATTGEEGVKLFRSIRELDPGMPVVMMTTSRPPKTPGAAETATAESPTSRHRGVRMFLRCPGLDIQSLTAAAALSRARATALRCAFPESDAHPVTARVRLGDGSPVEANAGSTTQSTP